MKTRWQFFFLVNGFRFDRQIKYKVTSTHLERNGEPAPEFAKEFFVKIIPDEEPIRTEVDQSGKFELTFCGTPEETKEFAYWSAHELATRISFEQGHMDLIVGLVFWERIPENDDERAQFGNTPFGADLRLQEVVEPPSFDPSSIGKHSSDTDYSRLMTLFIESKRSRTLVEQFLGFFRIVEFFYSGAGGHNKLEPAMLSSDTLRNHVTSCTMQSSGGEPITDNQFRDLVKDLVVTRHRCAHLRGEFGITPRDEEDETVVAPLLPIVEDIARLAIEGRFGPERSNGALE